jgi:TetR/AcrR family transcriptional repressor of nem operon
VHEVIALQACELLEPHRQQLRRFDSFQRLQRWRDCIVKQDMLARAAILAACAGEPANSQEECPALVEQFEEWEKLLADGLRRMRAVGALCADVEPEKLATGIMAALQGGYLLARVARDNGPLTIALDMAISQVKSFCREEQCNVE